MHRRGRGHLPPGYPAEYQRHVKLQDGRQVFIRPILPSDAAELARAIKTADADTLRRRFLGGPPPVTPALLAHLTRLDYQKRFALVAIDPATGSGVAVARYESAGNDAAEVAVAVSPSWRNVGLAAALIGLLAQAARQRGIVTFTAAYLAGNRPVAALADQAGAASRQVIEQGVAEFSIALEQHDAATADSGPGPAAAPAARAEQDPDTGRERC